MNNIKNLTIEEKLKYMTNSIKNNEVSEEIKNNCKYILKNYAFSGIKGSTIEKNINLIYNLFNN